MSLAPLFGNGRIRAREERADPLHTASWIDSRIVFDHRRWRCADAELRWTAPHHLLLLTEKGGTSQTLMRLEGQAAYDGHDRPGVVTFVPASTERVCAYRDADLIYSALWIDPSIQDRLSGCEALPRLPPIMNGNDPVIGSLLASLRVEISEGREPGAAYVEHLVALVLMRLAALRGAVPPKASAGRLSRKALARVEDYIEARLGTDMALADLAELVDLPIDAFARRFKAATGLAPYAFVIERRVRRAETLLRSTDMEIGTIALALGFSSQSHFTTTFRRATGTTPGAYRANFSPES